MALELVAIIIAGLAAGGLAHLLGRLLGGRLPRWSVPIAAGIVMLIAAIASEYSWYDRTRAGLPDGLEVAQSVQSSAFWRPWTYLAPMTDRFVAVDLGHRSQNTAQPDLYLVDLYFYGRWRPVTSVEVMVDCAGLRRADPVYGDGSQPLWRDVGAKDPVLSTTCASL